MKNLIIILLIVTIIIPSSQAMMTIKLNEKKEILVELPDGRIFWYDGTGNYENITEELCRSYNLTGEIHQNFSIIDSYYLKLYHYDNGWKRGEGGNIMAWCDGIPRSTPGNKYPRFSSYPQISYYAPGNTEIWNYSIGSGAFGSIDSTVIGFADRIFFNSWNGFYSLDLDGNLIWENKSIRGMSTPYIYNKRIFVGSSDGHLYSLDIDGKVIWKKKICNSPGYVGISSSPIVINNTVYIGGYESDNRTSYLHAININGSEIWNVSLKSSVYYGSLSYYNGTVYVPLTGKYNSSDGKWYPDYGIMAVKDGKIAWLLKTNNSVKSTPLIYNNSIYFTSTNGYLYRLSMDGKIIWKIKIGYSTSSPNAWNGIIFVGTGNFNGRGKIYAISEDSKIIWERNVSGGVQSGITITPPIIYFSINSENGGVACYNFEGEKLWNFSEQYVLSTPSIISKFLLFGDDSGIVHALKDSSPPVILFYGGNFYSYNDIVNISINAMDNIGVRSLKVKYGNKTIVGKENITIEFHANFTGEMNISAIAEDYDGNLKYENFSVYISKSSLKIVFSCEDKVMADKRLNYTLRVEDSDGNLVDKALVNISLDNRTIISGYTKNGFFSFSLSISKGKHALHIEASKYGYKKAELWREVEGIGEEEKNEGVSYLIPIIITIAFLTAVAVIIAYILRKKHKRYQEITRERLKNQK